MAAALTAVPARHSAGPKGAGTNRPAILVLPGGGYARQADHEAEPVAEWLAALGIHAFVLRYRVAPDRHPAPLEDAKEAMLHIRNGSHGLAVDPDRVGVLGFSAGGHLAATLSTATPTGSVHLDVPEAVPASHSLEYAGALMSAGVAAELHVFPRGRHGLGLAAEEPGPDQWTQLCAAWLDRAGWTSGPSTADSPD